jgi:hypothetical protein
MTDNMNFSEIKKAIMLLLSSPNPSAQDWADIMASLQFLLSDVTEQALAKEITAMVKFRDIRANPNVESKADAEINWKATEEWDEWRKSEEIKKEIEGWKTVASRQTSARYRGY